MDRLIASMDGVLPKHNPRRAQARPVKEPAVTEGVQTANRSSAQRQSQEKPETLRKAESPETKVAVAPEKPPEVVQPLDPVAQRALWDDQLAEIFDGGGTAEDIASKVIASAKKKKLSPEYGWYADLRLASWLRDVVEQEEDLLEEALLADLEYAELFVGELKAIKPTEAFVDTKKVVDRSVASMTEEIDEQLTTLNSLATEAIEQTGTSYQSIDEVLDLSFALAGEFEEAGFVSESETVLQAGLSRIDTILQDGLDEYREELSAIEPTSASIEALREEAETFAQLGQEFEAFAAYETAAKQAIISLESGICARIVEEATDDKADAEKLLLAGDANRSLTDVACSLYDNGHTLTAFKNDADIDGWRLALNHADGSAVSFRLREGRKADDGPVFVGDAIVIDDEVSEIGEEEWIEEITTLLRPPPTGLPDENGVTECDLLAADPNDPKKRADGIDYDTDEAAFDDFDRALDACIAAVEVDRDNPRLLYQLGRLLAYAGDEENAEKYIEEAANADYGAALHSQAEKFMLSGDENDFVDAVDLFKRSAAAGYKPSKQMIDELDLGSLDLFKEIPPPTGRDLMALFSPVIDRCVNVLGVRSCVELTNIRVRNCFQSNATDFSCEYRPTISCSTNQHQIYNMIMDAACSDTIWEFGDFRKHRSGRWSKIN